MSQKHRMHSVNVQDRQTLLESFTLLEQTYQQLHEAWTNEQDPQTRQQLADQLEHTKAQLNNLEQGLREVEKHDQFQQNQWEETQSVEQQEQREEQERQRRQQEEEIDIDNDID
jgi:hypothetical protein